MSHFSTSLSSFRNHQPSRPVGNDIGSRFGHRIRSIRRERNITQLRMAIDFGIDRSFISDMERGLKQPSLFTVSVIADGFKIPIHELVKDL
jgi:transcriptional regulator with XRE-family HTH domain